MTRGQVVIGITLLVLAHTVVAQQCQKWCAKNTNEWPSKCTWKFCGACSECATTTDASQVTTSAGSMTTKPTTNLTGYGDTNYSYGAYYSPPVTTTTKRLPGCEHVAARILGYTQATWDNLSGEEPLPKSVDKEWAELTDKQRTAAQDLGYTELSWERAPGWKGPWPSHAHSWSGLKPDARKAMIVLGYTKKTFDDIYGPQPPIDTKLWAELTDKELKAAKELGYNAVMWDTAQPTATYKKWRQMSLAERDALVVLGWNQTNWDYKKKQQPAAKNKFWSQLTNTERKAARVFGHSDASWDNGIAPPTLPDKSKWAKLSYCDIMHDPVCGSDGKSYFNGCHAGCARVNSTSGKCNVTITKNHTHTPSYNYVYEYYYNYSYGDFTTTTSTHPRGAGCEHYAATILGFSPFSWDNVEGGVPQPASVRKEWSELTVEEKTAAEDLGYTELSWERAPGWKGPWPSHVSWSGLTVDHRNALLVLGYTEKTFDDIYGPQPPIDTKIWDEFTDKEIEAAKVLGYNAVMWDSAPPTASSKKWRQMSLNERDALVVLGWNQTNWDNKKEQQPAAKNKFWSQLTNTEKKAARFLGHSDASWDNTVAPPTLLDKYKWTELTSCITLKKEPVCADGKPYRNICHASCARIKHLWRSKRCNEYSQEHRPVCGSDGKPYKNSCTAACSKVDSWTTGRCNTTPDNPNENVANDSPNTTPLGAIIAAVVVELSVMVI